MRVILSIAVLALPLLSGCAADGAPNRYQLEINRLEAECRERDGILMSTGSQTGEAARDYACRIPNASRLH